MKDNSIDLIITSPPYNKNAYATDKGGDKSWAALRGRQIPYDKYDDNLPPPFMRSGKRMLFQSA